MHPIFVYFEFEVRAERSFHSIRNMDSSFKERAVELRTSQTCLHLLQEYRNFF